jgi:hypothetical protein
MSDARIRSTEPGRSGVQLQGNTAPLHMCQPETSRAKERTRVEMLPHPPRASEASVLGASWGAQNNELRRPDLAAKDGIRRKHSDLGLPSGAVSPKPGFRCPRRRVRDPTNAESRVWGSWTGPISKATYQRELVGEMMRPPSGHGQPGLFYTRLIRSRQSSHEKACFVGKRV